MEKEYKLKAISDSTKLEIDIIIEMYDLKREKFEIYKALDYTYCCHIYDIYNDSNLIEKLTSIFILLYCSNIQIGGILKKKTIVLNKFCSNGNILLKIKSDTLKNQILDLLKKNIDIEFINFYYNNFIINTREETYEEKEKSQYSYGLINKYKKGVLTLDEFISRNKELDSKYPDKEIDYMKDFYSAENLCKIINYHIKNYIKLSPRQYIGKLVDTLYPRLKYNVLGYKKFYSNFIECPDEEETEGNKKIWEKYIKELKKEEERYANIEQIESKNVKFSKYKQYILLYELLYAIGIIELTPDAQQTNKYKYKYIADSIIAFKKLNTK